MLSLASSPCLASLRRVIARHRVSVPLWGLAVGMLVTATSMPARDGLAIDLSRWAILLALAASILTCVDLTRHVIRRLTQIVALWAEDVMGDDYVPPQRGGHDGDVTTDVELRKLADIARARRRRAARQEAERGGGL